MSKSEHNNIVERERKFLITEETANLLIKNASGNILKDFISQSYLFKENSKVVFDSNSGCWSVSLFFNDGSKENILLEQIENRDVVISVLTPFGSADFTQEKDVAIRFRNKKDKDGNNKIIFTFKLKNKTSEHSIGDYEFNVELTELNYTIVSKFLAQDNYQVVKERYTLVDKNYEIDRFINININDRVLEIEFDSEDEYNLYIPDFEFIKEVTGLLEFKNNYMAKCNGDSHSKA